MHKACLSWLIERSICSPSKFDRRYICTNFDAFIEVGRGDDALYKEFFIDISEIKNGFVVSRIELSELDDTTSESKIYALQFNIEILTALDRIVDAFYDQDAKKFYIIQKRLGTGNQDGTGYFTTLQNILERNELTVLQKLDIAIKIAKNLEALHKLGIISLDLNVNNILCPACDIVDFGMSARIKDGVLQMLDWPYHRNNDHLPLECRNSDYKEHINFSVDVFSLGKILLQNLDNGMGLKLNIFNTYPQHLARTEQEQIIEFINSMCATDSNRRPTLSAVIDFLTFVQLRVSDPLTPSISISHLLFSPTVFDARINLKEFFDAIIAGEVFNDMFSSRFIHIPVFILDTNEWQMYDRYEVHHMLPVAGNHEEHESQSKRLLDGEIGKTARTDWDDITLIGPIDRVHINANCLRSARLFMDTLFFIIYNLRENHLELDLLTRLDNEYGEINSLNLAITEFIQTTLRREAVFDILRKIKSGAISEIDITFKQLNKLKGWNILDIIQVPDQEPTEYNAIHGYYERAVEAIKHRCPLLFSQPRSIRDHVITHPSMLESTLSVSDKNDFDALLAIHNTLLSIHHELRGKKVEPKN